MTPEEKKALLFVPCEVECPQQGLQTMCNPDMCVRYKAFYTGYMVGLRTSFNVYRKSYKRGWNAALNEFVRRFKLGNESKNTKKVQKITKMMKQNLTKAIKEDIKNGYEEDRMDEPEESRGAE